MRGKWRAQRADRGAHAARGFVGGAASDVTLDEDLIRRFQCRTRLCGWCSTVRVAFCPCQIVRFNAARGFVGGAARTARSGNPERKVSMPHAALWVVQQQNFQPPVFNQLCFNAARGFVGGAASLATILHMIARLFQCRTRLCGWCSFVVTLLKFLPLWFQCRTRLCGWCSIVRKGEILVADCFNAARGFVGGAARHRG